MRTTRLSRRAAAVAGAAAGESPFWLTAPKGGTTSTDARVEFSWWGLFPAGEECTLRVEGAQVKNPQWSELGIGERSKYELDGSCFHNSLSRVEAT